MGFIKADMSNVEEPKPAPEGEYDLRILKAVEKESKKSGREMIQLTIVFDDGTAAPPFNHFLMNPTDDDDEDQTRMRLLELKRFCAAFDVDEDFEAEDLVGQTAGNIFVTTEEGDDGVIRNKMRLPKIKE